MDDVLFRQVKEHAARVNASFTRVVEESLREYLARRRPGRVREPIRLPTFAGEGLLPGVDLDDTAALLDVMESQRATD